MPERDPSKQLYIKIPNFYPVHFNLILMKSITLTWCPLNKLMISPFIFVHPSKQHIHQLNNCILSQGKLINILLVLVTHLVGDVDDIGGFALDPVLLTEVLVNVVFHFVEKRHHNLV